MTPRPCSGCGREKTPFTRRPGAFVLGSATDSVASPAVEITVAVVEAVYSLATPGVNGPKFAGAPIVSASVAGTEPPTGRVGATVEVRSASETSKKMFPTAATLTRTWVPATFGHGAVNEPSLGVLSAITVSPWSEIRLIFTFAALIGETSVPATSHVIVCATVP